MFVHTRCFPDQVIFNRHFADVRVLSGYIRVLLKTGFVVRGHIQPYLSTLGYQNPGDWLVGSEEGRGIQYTKDDLLCWVT